MGGEGRKGGGKSTLWRELFICATFIFIRMTQRGALADRIVDDITTAQQLHVLLQSSLSKELHNFGLTPIDLIPER